VDKDWQYEENEKTGLSNGQIIFIGTDGIWEARNQAGEMFGKDRLYNIIRQKAAGSASEIVGTVTDALYHFRNGIKAEDDVTMVVIKIGVMIGKDLNITNPR